jgi:pyruvate,water dikinase
MHFPSPLPALEGELWGRVMQYGFCRAQEAYQTPIRARAKQINTYHYDAMVPAVPLEEMEAQGQKAGEQIGAAIARLGELWEGEWLPEIKGHLAWWDAYELSGATPAALQTHLDQTVERMDRLWELHFRIVLPAYAAMSMFDDLYRDLFGGEGALASYELLQGFDNKTLERNRGLWDLSRKARQAPQVREVLEKRASAEVMGALEQSAEGRTFLAELRACMEELGQCGTNWGLTTPTWNEDPAPALKNIKDYLSQPDGEDPRVQLAALATQREEALAQARAKLQGYPQQVAGQFEFLLKAAQLGVVLSEDHGFWIDFNSMARVRGVLLEVGQRLVRAGFIAAPEEVFHLRLAEVRAALEAGADCRPLVAQRQAEIAHFGALTPPPRLGMDYGPPPDNPMTRIFGKLFGGPPPATTEEGVLKGHAGSAGKAQGRARVIRTLEEAGRLKLGDILVAETTSPPWTPLFATAGGIVTDTGGILSHCAVVAREYRIPAVVGTGGATKLIREGQLIEVDGDTGTVRIVAE